MKFYYINHKGERINFYEFPYLFQEGELLNWKYSYNSEDEKEIRLYKEPKEFKVKIAVMPNNSLTYEKRHEQYIKGVNRLLDVLDQDAASSKEGKLYADDGSYIKCIIFASDKQKWKSEALVMYNQFYLVSKDPSWIREKKITYERKQASDTGYLDYPYDYPYDYNPNDMAVYLENTEVMPADFKLVIQGPCENPQVTIGQNKCQIMTTLSSYEYIVLNSMDRTAYKVSSTGTVTNVFESLNRNYENFDKIPQGKHIISINGTFKMEITMYMKRSEPRWT